MSLIQGFKLSVEEYVSEAPWIEKLLRPLNAFAQSAINAINGNLIVGQNVKATYKTSRVTMPAIPWASITPTNGWTNASGEPPLSYYYDDAGLVYLRGSLAPGTKTDATSIGTLPSGVRPATDTTLSLPTDQGSSHGQITIKTNGEIQLFDVAGSVNFIHVNSIVFPAVSPRAPLAHIGPDWPLTLATDFANPVAGVFVVKVVDLDGNETTASGISGVHWEPSGQNQVIIRRVNGLTPTRQYDISFLILGG